jgi:hypothetical protein
MSLFLLIFGENISKAEFEMILAETACWDIKRKYSQIFNEDFYFPLYLPLRLQS